MQVSVRRGAARLAAVFTVLVAFLALGAAPARAADDRVQLRLPSSFTAGGAAGSVTVVVTRRSDGCVDVRTGLLVRLPGLTADRLRVEVAQDGDWQQVALTGRGDGLVVTGRTAPEKDRLCERKSIAMRYRIAFLDGAPGGTASMGAAAYAASGALIGQVGDNRRVRGPSPSPSASPSPTPTPSATATAEPTEAAAAPQQTPTQASVPVAAQRNDGGFGLGTAVMLVGVAMVGIGIGLLVLLLRRGRGDRDDPGSGGYPYVVTPPPSPFGGGGESPTLILPGSVAGSRPVAPGPPPVPPYDQAQTMILPKLPD